MRSVGLFVGEQENWTFFKEIAADLERHFRTEAFRRRQYRTPLLHGRLNHWAFQRGIRDLMRRSDVAFFEWASELLAPASRMPKTCAIVARLHSFELYAWAPGVNWDHVDKVILVSEAMRRKFCDLYPAHAAKTEVVYNGCSLDRFRPDPARKFRGNLGMLCTLYPRKRVYDMLLELSELRAAGHDLRLHVAGGIVHGPDLDEYFVALHRLVAKLHLQDSVTFHDHLGDPSEWLRNIDIFISNSYWEGHQVALIEAMAAGCYCLSHFWDGAEEVLPAECLYGTNSEFRRKAIEFCHLPDEARQERQARIQAVAAQRFDIETTKARIRAIVAEVAGRD